MRFGTNFGFQTNGRRLPKQGLLVHLKSPNSDNYLDGESGETLETLMDAGYALPVECYAAVGTGAWFSDSTTPITRVMSEILASMGTEYNWQASATKGVSVYLADTELSKINRARKFHKLAPNYEYMTVDGETLTIDGETLAVGV